jgi:hypothetical protein
VQTDIVIDDKLIKQAMRAPGAKSRWFWSAIS